MVDLNSDIWAITSYFNPLGYRRRLANYRTFRDKLEIPLVTVELCYGEPALSDRDADVYVQLHGGAILWQKERLLNIALRALPAHVKYVAWLDCDIVFARSDWALEARRTLAHCKLIQPFSRMYRLGPQQTPETTDTSSMEFGTSIVQLMAEGRAEPHDFRPNSTANNLTRRRGLFGLAWAAERALMEKHSFYDAMIVGSGDRALASAAMGSAEDAVDTMQMSSARADHYRAWAERFHADVQGQIGFVEGAILHCWHGDPADRRYMERHTEFAKLEFDPARDIAISDNGLWAWTAAGHRLEPFLKGYFAGRQEDGRH